MLDETLLTLTLPRWYVERLSEDVENEAIYYAAKVRAGSRFPTAEPTTHYMERMQRSKARWEAVESAITTALDADLSGSGSYGEEGLTCAGCGNVLTAPERCEFCGNHSEV